MSVVRRALRQKRLALAQKPRWLPLPIEPEPPLLEIDLGKGPSETVISLLQLQETNKRLIVEAMGFSERALEGKAESALAQHLAEVHQNLMERLFLGSLRKETAHLATSEGLLNQPR